MQNPFQNLIIYDLPDQHIQLSKERQVSVFVPQATWNESNKNLLNNILKSIQLNQEETDFLVVDANQKRLKLDIKNDKILLLFGIKPKHIGLMVSDAHYQWIQVGQLKILQADGLDMLSENVQLKKKLWSVLKKIF